MKGGDSLNEQIVMKGLLSKESYTKYHPIVSELDTLPKEVRSLLTTAGEYWERYPDKTGTTEDDLFVLFTSLYPKSKDTEFVKEFLTGMKEIQVNNPEVLTQALNTVVYRHFMSRVMSTASRGLDTNDPEIPGQIATDLEDLKVLAGTVKDPESRVYKKSMVDIVKAEESINLQWRTPLWQRALGNPRPGRLHHVFGHVHSGKSLLLISECTWFGRQMHKQKSDDTVMYITNEEGCDQLMPRVYASFLGQPISLIYQFPERAEKAYRENGGDYIKVIEDVNHITQVQRNIADLRPRILFIDQGTKIRMSIGKNDAKHEMLQRVYHEYRRLVVKHQMDIISSGQADDRSQGRRWLGLNNMDGSKVGVPGELDVAMGIGHIDDEGYEAARFLSFCKNRYNGKLERDSVTINQEKVRFE